MKSNFIVKLALSTAFVAVLAMTPTASATGAIRTSKESAKQASPEKALQWAKKAEQAIAKNKNDRALQFAELVVEAEPQSPDYRALLARIYMAKGRFASAERTLMDVIELGKVDPRTVISLALSRIAQGNTESAVALIDSQRSILPVSDYGLTLALAGRSGEAIRILIDAVRNDSASSRTRQNLALAYALDGRWRDARVMASQDMAQDAVNEHIAEWAQFAQPGAYTLRVAGLLKIRPDLSDLGQPAHLALNHAAAPALAVADNVPAAPAFDALSPDPATEPAAIAPTVVAQSAGFAAVEKPMIKVSNRPAKLGLAEVPASRPAFLGKSHLIQLGAFSSAASAQAAWKRYAARYGALRGLKSVSSTVTVNGRKLTRIAAMALGDAARASATCRQIKSQGGACFVVPITGSQSVRLAQGGRLKIALR
jgi:Flp pilus assembly protein TadD